MQHQEETLNGKKQQEFINNIRAQAAKECAPVVFELKYKTLYTAASWGQRMGAAASLLTFAAGVGVVLSQNLAPVLGGSALYVGIGLAATFGLMLEWAKGWAAGEWAKGGRGLVVAVALTLEAVSFGGSLWGAYALTAGGAPAKFDNTTFVAERATRRKAADDYAASRKYKGILANKDVATVKEMQAEVSAVDGLEEKARAEFEKAQAASEKQNKNYTTVALCIAVFFELLIFASAWARRWYINGVYLLNNSNNMTTYTQAVSSSSNNVGSNSAAPHAAPNDIDIIMSSDNVDKLKRLYTSTRFNLDNILKGDAARAAAAARLQAIAERLAQLGHTPPTTRTQVIGFKNSSSN